MQLEEIQSRVLPQFFPAHWLEDISNLVHTDFPSCIRIGYVVRDTGSYHYLLEEDIRGISISLPELNKLALDNLRRLPTGNIRIAEPPWGPEGYVFAEDNFAAVRILLAEVRKMFASKLGKEFLATLPHRDDCFCWSRAQPDEYQKKHAADAVKDYQGAEHSLTPDIFLVTEAGVHLHEQQLLDGGRRAN
jgi:uncharacterized protein YtpQ (UPF0354 family)